MTVHAFQPNYVQEVRLSRGITQRELATEAGVGERTLQRLEAGQGVRVSTWQRVLVALGSLAGGLMGLSDGRPLNDRGRVAAVLESFGIPTDRASVMALTVLTTLGSEVR